MPLGAGRLLVVSGGGGSGCGRCCVGSLVDVMVVRG